MQRIVIVGVGALGSHAALFLRNLHHPGPASLVLIDFDRIETKNTLAQFHARSGIGKNKAQSYQQTLNFLFGLKPEAVPHELTKFNVRELLGGAVLVLDCLDNAPSRRIVQDFVRVSKTPCLHGALDGDGTLGRVVWDDKFVIDEGDGPGATCEDGENLPFIAMVAAQLARSAQEFLKTGRQLSYQILSRSPTIPL